LVYFIYFYYSLILFYLLYLFIQIFTVNSTNEPIGDKNRRRLTLKRPLAVLGKDWKRCKSVAGWESTSEGENSWQAAVYEGAKVVEEIRNIMGRLRAGECYTGQRGLEENPDLPSCW
jgi:hypothetical protein